MILYMICILNKIIYGIPIDNYLFLSPIFSENRKRKDSLSSALTTTPDNLNLTSEI